MVNMKATLLMLCAALGVFPVSAAQFVELEARFEVTRWTLQEETGLRIKNVRTFPVHCVAGTNLWLIENQPRTNVIESSWFLNGKIVKITTVQRENGYGDPDYIPSRRVSRTGSLITAPDGYPGGDLLVNLPWFAFCSGPYLQHPKRGVPVPTAPPDRAAFGFTNETTFFTDSLRLPRRAEFFNAPGQTKCLYEVQQSTNVLGWNFPTAFTATYSEPDRFGRAQKELTVKVQVTAIRGVRDFTVPEEITEFAEREQSPTRRRTGGFRSTAE